MADEETTETVEPQDAPDPTTEPATAPPDPQAAPTPVEEVKPDPAKPGDTTALEAALKKANREAAERRRTITEMQAELDKMKEANASEAEKALLLAKKEAAEQAEARWRPAVVGVRAEAALMAAGCTDPGDIELLAGKIDASKVDLDDAGNVVSGLAEQVEALKEKHAKLFAPPKPARPAPANAVDAGPKVPAQPKKTASQLLAARLTGG